MDVIEAIKARKSIRGYKPTPVPRETLREVLDIARRAPSAMNTQPWEMVVVAGEVLDSIKCSYKCSNVELLEAGTPFSPEVPVPRFEDVYRRRQVDLAKQLFGLMEISREDKEGRLEWTKKGLRFYDAPSAIILLTDVSLAGNKLTAVDIGAFCQTVCLAALPYGLGTCIADQGIMYPQVVRRLAGIPDSRRIAISICIGYPDWDFPANRVISEREPLDGLITWLGFDQH